MAVEEVTVPISFRYTDDGRFYYSVAGGEERLLGVGCLHKCRCGHEHVGIVPMDGDES